MPVEMQRLIFELSNSERENKFNAVLSDALQKTAGLGLPLVYRNHLCTKPNMFVHKYPDGKKLLIEQDPENSSEKMLRILS